MKILNKIYRIGTKNATLIEKQGGKIIQKSDKKRFNYIVKGVKVEVKKEDFEDFKGMGNYTEQQINKERVKQTKNWVGSIGK